ncbi:unnamed protein product [Ceratitis capitata]|uniref:(Mediterranean fruit fly) hypothetical protein n=1 Tax=Ceratitis capitata TaxID=7213 RepID=A0A811UGX4_CERCA|nr:unnamed protein product [Ceratitis capitata]
MNSYKRRVTIFGLPKDWSVHRLHSELNKYTEAWNVVDIVPLEEDLIVYVNCKSEDSYDCDEEVWDFCMLVGRYLKFMIVDSLSDYATMDKYTKYLHWEGNLRCSVSMKIRRHLVHFPYLEILQIEGIFLADEVIDELARCCPKIRELQFMDAYTYFTTGEHFSSFRNLEVIDICSSMRCRLVEMLKVCHQLHLKKLNMVDTRRLYEPAFFSALVKTQYATLTTLWLSAIKDKDTILLILKLPLLVELKFYWKRTYEGFEEILFSALSETKQNSLHSVSFEVHPLPYEMISFRYFGTYSEAGHVLQGIHDGWELCESSLKEFLKLLDVCMSLEKLAIRYCSLFKEKDIFIFPEHCESLRLIQMIGQCRKHDEKFLYKWRERAEDCSCELRIEGELLYFTEQEMRLRPGENREAFSYRSIECNFKNPLLAQRNANDR